LYVWNFQKWIRLEQDSQWLCTKAGFCTREREAAQKLVTR
jgi:hypothetical protein